MQLNCKGLIKNTANSRQTQKIKYFINTIAILLFLTIATLTCANPLHKNKHLSLFFKLNLFTYHESDLPLPLPLPFLLPLPLPPPLPLLKLSKTLPYLCSNSSIIPEMIMMNYATCHNGVICFHYPSLLLIKSTSLLVIRQPYFIEHFKRKYQRRIHVCMNTYVFACLLSEEEQTLF